MHSSFGPKYRPHSFPGGTQMWSRRPLLSSHNWVCTLCVSHDLQVWSKKLESHPWSQQVCELGYGWAFSPSHLPLGRHCHSVANYSGWSISQLFGRVMTSIFLPLREDGEPAPRHSGFWLLSRSPAYELVFPARFHGDSNLGSWASTSILGSSHFYRGTLEFPKQKIHWVARSPVSCAA